MTIRREVLRGVVAVLMAGILAMAGIAQAAPVDQSPAQWLEGADQPSNKKAAAKAVAQRAAQAALAIKMDSGMAQSMRYVKALKQEDEGRFTHMNSYCERLGGARSGGALEMYATMIRNDFPGSTFNCATESGTMVQGSVTAEFASGKPWKHTFQSYGGIVYTVNFLEYPLVSVQGQLGLKFIHTVVDVEKETIAFVDSSLNLSITSGGNIRGENSAITDVQLNPIMEKAYFLLNGPYEGGDVGNDSIIVFINSMLASNNFRREFVSEMIPGLVKRAKDRGEAEPW